MTSLPTDKEQRRVARQVKECKEAHTNSPYFAEAERFMQAQWEHWIQPAIDGHDFRRILELAPGHGRNSAMLKDLAEEMWLVDVNQTCIDACRERFGERSGDCVFHYLVGDGSSLAGVPDSRITFVYSWDSMVHFDPLVIRAYVAEFARVLEPGGRGFVHHSNYGNLMREERSWTENPHWRSVMTRERFARYCEEAGLQVEGQQLIPWGDEPDLDCLSWFRKEA